MTPTLPIRPVVRYYLYQVTLSLGFYVPVSILYLRDLGFSLAFIGLAGAVFSFSLLLAEVPTGYLADRLGRRGTLALGTLCRIVAVGGYAVADAAITFLLLKVVFGVGWALRSGTTDAYLYELLAKTGEEDRFATVNGRGRAVLLATSAGTAILGGLLYNVDSMLPFILNAALAAFGLPLLASLPSTSSTNKDEPSNERFTVRQAIRSLREQASRPGVRWLVFYSILILLVFDITRSFEQPAYRAIGIDAAQLGILYAVFKLVSAGGGAAVGPIRNRVGTRWTLASLAPIIGIAYGLLLFLPELMIAVGALYRATRSILLPIRNQYLNDQLRDSGRATVLSGVSMVLSLVGGLGRIIAGVGADSLGPLQLLVIVGTGLALTAVVVWITTQPIRETPAQARDEQMVPAD